MSFKFGKTALDVVRKYHPAVTKVVDAKKAATIRVTTEDCATGNSKAPNSCALAKAACREYDGAIISLSTAYLIKGRTAVRYHVPQSISREIVSFDRSNRFEPGEYALKSISKSARLGARPYPQPKKHPGGNKYRKDKPRNHRTAGIRVL